MCCPHINVTVTRRTFSRRVCFDNFPNKKICKHFSKERIISRNYQCFQLFRVLATMHGCEKSSSLLLHRKSFYEKVFRFQVSRVKKIKNSVVTLLRASAYVFLWFQYFIMQLEDEKYRGIYEKERRQEQILLISVRTLIDFFLEIYIPIGR